MANDRAAPPGRFFMAATTQSGQPSRREDLATQPIDWWTLFPAKTQKRCTHCKEWLPNEAFLPNTRLKTGLASWCRQCAVKRTQQWRAENPDYIARTNTARRERYASDPDHLAVVNALRREQYAANRRQPSQTKEN